MKRGEAVTCWHLPRSWDQETKRICNWGNYITYLFPDSMDGTVTTLLLQHTWTRWTMRGFFGTKPAWNKEVPCRGSDFHLGVCCNPLSLVEDWVSGGKIFWEHLVFIKLLLWVESSCFSKQVTIHTTCWLTLSHGPHPSMPIWSHSWAPNPRVVLTHHWFLNRCLERLLRTCLIITHHFHSSHHILGTVLPRDVVGCPVPGDTRAQDTHSPGYEWHDQAVDVLDHSRGVGSVGL